MIPLTMVVTIGGVALLNALVFWLMPELTRRDLYFAVTVAPEFRDDPEGKSILRRYRGELAFLSAVALTAFIVAALRLGVLVVPGGVVIELAASFIAFYRARQHVRPHAVPPPPDGPGRRRRLI